MEKFVETLKANMGVGKPILTADVLRTFEGMPRSIVYSRLDAGMESGEIARFDRGVYYIPEPSAIPGLSMPLNPEAVLRRKYISDGQDVFGFRSGLALLNDRGISSQMPAVLEITTNRSPRRVYRVKPVGGYREVVLRKPCVPVGAENVAALKALDVLCRVDIGGLNADERAALARVVGEADRRILIDIAEKYPSKALSNLMRIEAEYAVPA